MSSAYVLDASALLCLLNDEAGSQKVADVLSSSMISSVNFSEVAAKLADVGMDAAGITDILAPLHLTIILFDEALAISAGSMRTQTRSAGLSFGDRACLALAQQQEAVALTADRAWKGLGKLVDVKIELIR